MTALEASLLTLSGCLSLAALVAYVMLGLMFSPSGSAKVAVISATAAAGFGIAAWAGTWPWIGWVGLSLSLALGLLATLTAWSTRGR